MINYLAVYTACYFQGYVAMYVGYFFFALCMYIILFVSAVYVV